MNAQLNLQSIAQPLTDWFLANPRSYPWRQNTTPYHIWISEVMLQQTQVKTVIPYYNKWFKIFPNVQSLSNSDLETVLKLWEGLGYYSRAKNIYLSSKIVVEQFNNKIPNTYKKITSLPGIGIYIAGAILSIAYNNPIPAIDGNVKRVFSRIFEFNFLNTADIKRLHQILSNILLLTQPKYFNQAIMDLGRYICTPKKPTCHICPINSSCISYQNNTVNKFPTKPKKLKRPHYNVAVGIVYKQNKLLITKRPTNILLGGLWEFPGGKIKKGETIKECIKRELYEEVGIQVEPMRYITTIKHQYSHFTVTIGAYLCEHLHGKPKPIECVDFKWINYNQIKEFPFPKANHKLFQFIKESLV